MFRILFNEYHEYMRFICLQILIGILLPICGKLRDQLNLDLLREHEIFMHFDQSCLLKIIMVDESWFL